VTSRRVGPRAPSSSCPELGCQTPRKLGHLVGPIYTNVVIPFFHGCLVEALTFFLLLTYVLKARGLTTASELTHGLWGSPRTPPIEEGPRTV
jgi:hypothetical protein